MTFLLDTNICSCINRLPLQLFARFEGMRYGEVAVSSIAGAELGFGVAKSGLQRNREAFEKFLAPLEVLPFDAAAMHACGPLPAELQ